MIDQITSQGQTHEKLRCDTRYGSHYGPTPSYQGTSLQRDAMERSGRDRCALASDPRHLCDVRRGKANVGGRLTPC